MHRILCDQRGLNWPKMDPSEVQRRYDQAIIHLEFAMDLCEIQRRGGRYYLHEHPHSAASWHEQCTERMLTSPDCVYVRADQCMFNLRLGPEDVTSLKPTGIMTNSMEVAALLDVRCSNDHPHRRIFSSSDLSQRAAI